MNPPVCLALHSSCVTFVVFIIYQVSVVIVESHCHNHIALFGRMRFLVHIDALPFFCAKILQLLALKLTLVLLLIIIFFYSEKYALFVKDDYIWLDIHIFCSVVIVSISYVYTVTCQ